MLTDGGTDKRVEKWMETYTPKSPMLKIGTVPGKLQDISITTV